MNVGWTSTTPRISVRESNGMELSLFRAPLYR
jgi:hypothetical protein